MFGHVKSARMTPEEVAAFEKIAAEWKAETSALLKKDKERGISVDRYQRASMAGLAGR